MRKFLKYFLIIVFLLFISLPIHGPLVVTCYEEVVSPKSLIQIGLEELGFLEDKNLTIAEIEEIEQSC